MERHGLRATLRLFGEPAEKVCGSKPIHAAKGYYDDLDARIQEQLFGVLANNARQAAAATNCRVCVRWVSKTRVGLPDHVLARAAYQNLELVGPPVFPQEAREFAQAIQQGEGMDPMAAPFTDRCQRLTPPEDEEAGVRSGLPPWQRNFTSDDYVEYALRPA